MKLRPDITDRSSRIGAAEAIAHGATLTALVLTYVLAPYTVELNPVASWLFDTIGYAATGGLAMVVVGLLFDGYRRLAAEWPRIAEGGAWGIASVGVLDVTINLWRLSAVGWPETALMETVWAIVLASGLGVASVFVIRHRSEVIQKVPNKRKSVQIGRLVVVSLVSVALILSAISGATVLIGSDSDSPSPVGKVQASGGSLSLDWSSGEVSGHFDPDETISGYSYGSSNSAHWRGQRTNSDMEVNLADHQISGIFRINNSIASTGGLEISADTDNVPGGNYTMLAYGIGSTSNTLYLETGLNGKDCQTYLTQSAPTNKWLKFDLDISSSEAKASVWEAGADRSTAWNATCPVADGLSEKTGTVQVDDTYNEGTKHHIDKLSVSGLLNQGFSESTATPTPKPERTDYELSVCYNGDAQFQPLGAEATWNPYPTATNNTWAPSEFTGDSKTTSFDSDKSTTANVESSPNTSYRVGVETDRASFVFSGINPTSQNTRGKFEFDTPFQDFVTDPDRISSRALCGEDGTATPGGSGGGTDAPGSTLTPGYGGSDADLTAIGTCTVPAANGKTKTGLLIEYWDPSYSTEDLWFNLTYEGESYSEWINFDTPKGYYYGCHGAGSGIGDGGGDGGTTTDAPTFTPYPTLTPYPNGTTPTPYPTRTPVETPTPYPPLTPYPNGTTPTPYPTQTPYANGSTPYPPPTPYPPLTPYPNGTTPTDYPIGTTDSPGEVPEFCEGEGANADGPFLELSANMSDGSTRQDTACGFDDTEPGNSVNGTLGGGLFGGGGGPLVGDDAGSGAPLAAVAIPALAAIGYAAYRRRFGGGSGSSTSASPPGRGGAP